jgi:hypothetical protein
MEGLVEKASASGSLTEPGCYSTLGTGPCESIYYSPDVFDANLSTRYLITYAPSSSNTRIYSVGCPATRGDAAFAVITSESDSIFLKGPEPAACFAIPPGGIVAEIYKVCEFSELRSDSPGDSVLICAPDAIGIEDGEEEIDNPTSPSSGEAQTSNVETHSTDIQSIVTPNQPQVSTIAPADDTADRSVAEDTPAVTETELSEATPEMEGSVDATPETSNIHDQEVSYSAGTGPWIFRFIGQFMFKILHWLITASKPRVDTIEGAEGSVEAVKGDDEDVDEPEAMTPADQDSPTLTVSAFIHRQHMLTRTSLRESELRLENRPAIQPHPSASTLSNLYLSI